MIETRREYSLELLVDDVSVIGGFPDDVRASDLRISIALSRYPIVHIEPICRNSDGCVSRADEKFIPFGDPKMSFGGSGKACAFQMDRYLSETAMLVFLLVRHVDALCDHVILGMTEPLRFRDLCLSLPSCSDGAAPPYVTREFKFLDNFGSFNARVRLQHINRKIVRPTMGPKQPRKPSALADTPPAPKTAVANPEIRSAVEDVTQRRTSEFVRYGKMRDRTTLMKLLK